MKTDTLIYNLYRTLEWQFKGKYPESIEALMHETHKFLQERNLLNQNEED